MLSFIFCLLCLLVHPIAASNYTERLLLRPLPQRNLLASFNFRSNETLSAFEEQHFTYFPRALGQILQYTHTRELHLRFALGRWDDESWGARPWDGKREGGTGVELWAWVDAKNEEEANARWLKLVNSLSGLFCASLNFIDFTKTTHPVLSFQTEGIHPANASANTQLLHGTLPHEVVCTENLTPFLKLLPCKGKAGISSLLDGHKLFDASWQAMSLDVRPVCPSGGKECLIEIEQTVDMVLNIDRSKRPRDNPIPRPPPIEEVVCDTSKHYHAADTCFPLLPKTEPAWSFSDVFGKQIRGACPISTKGGQQSETVCLNVPKERDVTVKSEGLYSEIRYDQDSLRCYQLPVGSAFDLALSEQDLNVKTELARPEVYASRSFTGYGQERGGMISVLVNPSPSNPISLVYFESLPWFLKPYMHTLRASLSPGVGQAHLDSKPAPDAIQEIQYRPAIDRHQGTHIEILLTIPPASALTLSYDFEKAILRYTEYPPDANRGFDVAPAVIRLLPTEQVTRFKDSAERIRTALMDGRNSKYLRTTSLLLPLPTPDFSMPYNVIILTSTVMALGFGSIFNILVRQFVSADEVPPSLGLKTIRERVRGRVQAVIARFGKSKPSEKVD